MVAQFPTYLRSGFIWQSDSKSLLISRIVNYKTIVSIEPILNGVPNETHPYPQYAYLIASLRNGNLLLSTKLYQDHNLIEIHPKDLTEVVRVQAGISYSQRSLSSHDGKFVFLGTPDDSIHVYNTESQSIETLPGPKGQLRVIASDRTRPRIALTLKNRKDMLVPISEESQKTATVNTHELAAIVIWNYEEGIADSWHSVSEEEIGHILFSAAFIDLGNKFVVLAKYGRDSWRLTSINFSTGAITPVYESAGEDGSISVSADGRYLAYACGPRLDILDASCPTTIVETVEAPGDFEFSKVEFSPDGQYLAVLIDGVVTVLPRRSSVDPRL
jgi:WD40 repeat protein